MIYKKMFSNVKKSDYIYLDNAGTSLKLNKSIKAVQNYYKNFPLNSHSFSDNYLHKEIKETIEKTRILISDWINCDSEEIAFMPSTTYSLNILALSFSKILSKNDRIIITKLEHSSNVYPWMNICKEKDIHLEFLPLKKNLSIDIEKIKIDNRVKIVSITHTSNSTGITNNISVISKLIKSKNKNCFIIVDACQSIVSEKINLKDWDIDALVFSCHKIYGPTGIGVLWIKSSTAKKIPNLLWGGGKNISPSDEKKINIKVYEKFEVGSLPLAQIFGTKEVFLFLKKINLDKQKKKYLNLRKYAIDKLSKIEDIIIYSKNIGTTILLFNLKKFHSHDVSNYLARNNIFLRGGTFCSPFIEELIKVNSALRISFAIYNNRRDIDKLIECLRLISIEKIIS